MKNKLLSIILAIIMVFSLGFSTFAGTNDDSIYLNSNGETFTCQDFNNAQKGGIIPQNVSFEQWVEVIKENERAFIEMEKNSNSIKKNRAPFSLKAGDILISNGTSSAGLTGHAGIAINKYNILHIKGPGSPPEIISFEDWKSDYVYRKYGYWTKIYRVDNQSTASKASSWTYENYVGKNYKYGFTGSLYSLNPTYCSKIVWQAYYNANSNIIKRPIALVLPYNLPKYFKDGYTPEQIYEYVN